MEIGAHTASHPILARISDAEARNDIARDKRRLEEL
ncbi:MAG: polysaccharide deacetylase family protein [Chromatiales bacterium]|nr:polysaccharide deacetylase family protein [Chromatiales bacterium]